MQGREDLHGRKRKKEKRINEILRKEGEIKGGKIGIEIGNKKTKAQRK